MPRAKLRARSVWGKLDMEETRQSRVENDLGRDDIRQLVRRIAVPSMLAQFVSVLYSIVDRMYIGHIPEVGELALAGVGVCGPVVTMIGSVASLVGMGGAPLMSIKMGEGDTAGARKILANCFVLICVFALVLMAVVIPLRQPMLLFFGASASTLPYADTYFLYYVTGTVFALLATGMNSFVTAQGFARKAMASVLLGAVMNIVLDPVFIFALDMGVAGAAIATVISQAASCAYALCFLLGKRAQIRIERPHLDFAVIRRVLLLGFTPFSIIAVDNAMIIAMNAVLQRYGGASEGDLMVTVATIVQSFMLVVTMPLGGISGGTSVNTIAQQAEMLYEYRSDSDVCLQAMERFFQSVVAHYRTMGITVNVELLGRRPGMGAVDPAAMDALRDTVSAIMQEYAGQSAHFYPSSTDCNIPLSMGVPSVAFGAYHGAGAHTRGEYILLSSLPAGFKIAMAAVLERFA